MISKGFIKELTEKQQTLMSNIVREYIQHLFLSYLYQKKFSEYILFKGGTALKIIYNSPRFSEDLDFSGFNINFKRVESLVLETVVDIERTKISTKIEESKSTTGGYLGIFLFELFEYKIPLQIEVSLRRTKKKAKEEIILIDNDYIPPYSLISLSCSQLVEEKIKALLDRGRPRDFFDIYFLLRSNIPIDKKNLNLYPVLKKLENTTIDFKKELKMLLPKSYHMLLKDFKEILKREVKKYGF